MLHIRRDIFRVTQAEMAAIAGARQATVSRWESGSLSPDITHLHRIREAAIARALDWNDSCFFIIPQPEAAE